MPTPVSTATQCLTEEAARVLADAAAVARRRFHAQTTSLHAISALLSLPSSLLRDACSRARSPRPYSRFQLRALDLCINVSLDRLPSSKSSDDEPPPVSNSLMAAIKRSQATQRRQPETYQIAQHTASSIYSISTIKVELKNFVISILDDPNVSRVLGDAGFRSTDIKLAILRPPAPPPPPARYFRGPGGRSPPLFLCNLTDSRSSVAGNIPFAFSRGAGDCAEDQTCKRIGEILAKSSGRNPLLIGNCAREALACFKKHVKHREGGAVLPSQIAGVDLICVEMEIREFVSNGGSKEAFGSKVEKLISALERHSGPGVVVNFGELKVLVEAEDTVKCLVLKLNTLLKIFKKKMWLIGEAADYETYRNFLNRFPSLEVDWDLHPFPITTSRSSAAELCTKSSLLGSFVPFGGFFSAPSDFRSSLGSTNKPFARCSTCNDNYARELPVITSRRSTVSVADQHSSTLPSWLQMAKSDVSEQQNVVTEISEEKQESNPKILWLQRKWDDICQQLHQGSENSNDGLKSNIGSGVSVILQKTSSQEPNIKDTVDPQPKSDSQSTCNLNLAPDHVSSSSISCVTTDLGLGTSASTSDELKNSESYLDRGLDKGRDYKLIVQKLTEKIAWQKEACCDVGQIISYHRGGTGEQTWIGFIGPDKIGKRKMAEALAELTFGNKENLIAVDLSIEERMSESHLVFNSKLPDDIGVRTGRETLVTDYIAEELSKKPCSVVLLENVDKTNESLAQRSLSHGIRTGKFLDSHGREISTMNAIFLITCNEDQDQSDMNNSVDFSEQRVLDALSWQMQIVIGEAAPNCSCNSTVTLATGKKTNKRKQNYTDEPFTQKKPRSFLDLNLPLQEEISEDSRSWLKDFLEQIDRKVKFKPFNFDAVAAKLLNKMNLSLQKSLGPGFRLEVDKEVMSQILAASLCSDGEGPLDDWIKDVFGKACAEAQRIYSLHEQTSLNLVSCPGMTVDKQAPGIRLPRMINLG